MFPLPTGQTQVNCGDPNRCCNSYYANLALRVAEGHVWLVDERGGFQCYGDQTAMCCGFATGADLVVEVEGELHVRPERSSYDSTYVSSPRICRVDPDR
ncbi:MAG: hypothetical protein R3B13_16580 [Polyangiaceae bacterium]